MEKNQDAMALRVYCTDDSEEYFEKRSDDPPISENIIIIKIGLEVPRRTAISFLLKMAERLVTSDYDWEYFDQLAQQIPNAMDAEFTDKLADE